MKVKVLLDFLNELSPQDLEKEITFYDYIQNLSHSTLHKPVIIDLNNEKYLDFVFNISNEDLEYKVYERAECPIYNTVGCEKCDMKMEGNCLIEGDTSVLFPNDTENIKRLDIHRNQSD